MNKIDDRHDFAQYCLRQLGAPVINIEVAESQIDDRIQDALDYYIDRHYDATEEQWVHYEITADDVTNKTLTVPEDILTVVSITPTNRLVNSTGTSDMFSYQYQIMVGELSSWEPFDSIDYYMKMTSIEETRWLTNVNDRFKFIRHENKIRLYKSYSEGEHLILRVFRILDPDDVWNDRWLKQYATALIKKQWGNNLAKFSGVSLLGGVQIDSDKITSEAEAEITKLEEQLLDEFSEPTGFIFG